MKLDLRAKTQKLAERIPGFSGYRAVHHLEADWLLRRFLAAEVEKVRDRLADFLAAGDFPADLREKLALSLRTMAFLKDEVAPRADEARRQETLSLLEEERLLDFDLALEEKVAALHTPLDALEAAGDPDELALAAGLFDEGLAEVDDLFRLRCRVLSAGREPETPG
jgi:hypothetical protein